MLCLKQACYVIWQAGLAAIGPHIGILFLFIQNILHNISHTHLLTVPNTVGSVSSLSVTGCQATISSCSAVFSFCPFLCLQSISPVSLMPSCPQWRTFFFFLLLSSPFFLCLFPLRCISGLAVSLLLFETDKVTHCGLNHRSNQS